MSITTLMLRSPAAAAGFAILFLPFTSMAAAHAADRGSEATQKFEVRKDRSGQTVYCAQIAPATGSRVTTTRCETADDWKTDGVELHVAPANG